MVGELVCSDHFLPAGVEGLFQAGGVGVGVFEAECGGVYALQGGGAGFAGGLQGWESC